MEPKKRFKRHNAIARQVIAAAPQEQMHGSWRHVSYITHPETGVLPFDAVDQRHPSDPVLSLRTA